MFRTFLLLLVLSTPALADWPQWRGPGRNGVASTSPKLRDSLPDGGLKPLWLNKDVVAKGHGEGWSSPVVADGKVLLLGRGKLQEKMEERIACLDASTGEQLWSKTLASEAANLAPSSTPAVVGNRLYVVSGRSFAWCLDAETGEEIWSQELAGEVKEQGWQSSVLVVDEVAVLIAGKLVGLDGETGKVLWKGKDAIGEGVHGSPALVKFSDQSLVVANIGNGETVAVEPTTGKELWRQKTEAVQSTPVVHGDLMLTLGHSRKGGLRCYRVSAEGVEELWKHQAIADQGSSPVVVNDHVYVQGERKLACVRLEDGKEAWTTDLNMKDPRYTSLVASDGQVMYALEGLLTFATDPKEFRLVYHGLVDREGVLADEATHRQLLKLDELPISSEGQKEAEKKWQQHVLDAGPLSCTSPAISDGRLYVRLKNGLACYDLRK